MVRNSGQYWKAPGLIRDSRGTIELTRFGRQVADGEVTRAEFAATVLRTVTLPNPRIFEEDEVARWAAAGLQIKPLELVLSVLDELRVQHGRDEAYITPNELISIVIPLAGVKAPVPEHVARLVEHRDGRLTLTGWPNCAPEPNDRRMAREFLLFLMYYGFCRREPGTDSGNYNEKYCLAVPEVTQLLRSPVEATGKEDDGLLATVNNLRDGNFTSSVERELLVTTVLARPQQATFRRQVLAAYNCACLFTGERMADVLEAAHIIPVPYNGSDQVQNGLCLRCDIHNLYDTGHIRIEPGGTIHYSHAASNSLSYRNLPMAIVIPRFVDHAAMAWRYKYL